MGRVALFSQQDMGMMLFIIRFRADISQKSLVASFQRASCNKRRGSRPYLVCNLSDTLNAIKLAQRLWDEVSRPDETCKTHEG
jgi:hypothetical protein